MCLSNFRIVVFGSEGSILKCEVGTFGALAVVGRSKNDTEASFPLLESLVPFMLLSVALRSGLALRIFPTKPEEAEFIGSSSSSFSSSSYWSWNLIRV